MKRSIPFYIVLAAGLFAFIHAFRLLSPIILSFILILLISLAANPVVARLRAWTGGRRGATAVVVSGVVAVMLLGGWAFFVPMKNSLEGLARQLPTYWERLQKPLIRLEQQAVISEQKLQEEVTQEITEDAVASGEPVPRTPDPEPEKPVVAQESESLRSSLIQTLQNVGGSFTAAAVNAAQIMVVLVTVFFGVIFTLMNPRPVFSIFFALVPERHHSKALTILQRIGKFVPAWAGSTLLGMLVIGFLVFLAMWPIFGFADALALGLIAGIFEAVPYLGPILSVAPALLFALGEGGLTPLWVILAYGSIQALENNVILPLIMARGMKLHPLAVIFSMLLCVAAFGVLGVIVAAPLVAIIQILHDEIYRQQFLPSVTDDDIDSLARQALREKRSSA